MWEELLKAVPVFFSSMLKFIFGPLGGYAEKLHILTTVLATVAGMMTSVIAFTYFGKYLRERLLRKFFKTPKPGAVKTSRWTSVFNRYGLGGIAFLTPLILTPIGGTLLAVGFGSSREKIILYMLISAVAWAVILTTITYYVGHKALPDFIK